MSGTTRGASVRRFTVRDGVGFEGGFPYQNDAYNFDTVGLAGVGGGSFAVLFTRDALLEVFPHNLGYFLFGRHHGIRDLSVSRA